MENKKITTSESKSFESFTSDIPPMQMLNVIESIKKDGIVFDKEEFIKDDNGRITEFKGFLNKFNWGGTEECKDYTLNFTVIYEGDNAVEEHMNEQFFSMDGKEKFNTRKTRSSFEIKDGWLNYYDDYNSVTNTELFTQYMS